MIRVNCLHLLRKFIDISPKGFFIRDPKLHLIAECPHQQSRMVLVCLHNGKDGFRHLLAPRLISIIRALRLMGKPKANRHRDPVLRGRVQSLLRTVCPPSTDRVPAARGKLRQVAHATRAAYKVVRSAACEAVGALAPYDFHGYDTRLQTCEQPQKCRAK